MKKARKTHGSVRGVFKRDFADPEFVMMFQEERARSELALAVSRARQSAGFTQAELAEKADRPHQGSHECCALYSPACRCSLAQREQSGT